MPGRIRRSFSPLCYHRARVSKEEGEKHFTQAPFAHGPPTQPSQEEKGKFNKAEWGGEKKEVERRRRWWWWWFSRARPSLLLLLLYTYSQGGDGGGQRYRRDTTLSTADLGANTLGSTPSNFGRSEGEGHNCHFPTCLCASS